MAQQPLPQGVVSSHHEWLSLRFLLPLALLVFTAIILGYLYLAALGHDRMEAESDMLHEQAVLAARLQAASRYIRLSRAETKTVQAEFSALSAAPEIMEALLTDEHGKVLAASHMEWIGKNASIVGGYAEHAGDEAGTAGHTWLSANHHKVLSVYPVIFKVAKEGSARTGKLFLEADPTYSLAERNARTNVWMLRNSFLAVCLALLLWLTLHFAVTRRVAKLLHAIELAGKRRTEVVSGMGGADEIGRLGLAFDGMMYTLSHYSERARKLSQAVEQSATSIIVTDLEGFIEYVNPAFTEISGYAPEEVIGRRASILKSGLMPKETYAQLWATIKGGGTWRGELRNQRKNGTFYWDAAVISPVRNEEGEITNFVAVQEDITSRKETEERLLLSMHLLDSLNEGVAVTDAERNLVYVNPAFTAITGYAAEEVLGKNPHVLSSGLMDQAFYEEMWKDINESGHWEGEIIDRRKNGESYAEWLSITALKADDGEISRYVSVFTDISDRKETEQQVAHMAQHDFLTGLPNRMLLLDRLSQAIAHARRAKLKVAVMFLDLDRFKSINDTLGHFVGDKLLQEVSGNVGRVSRASDTVCRIGGDEFVIMSPNLESAEDVTVIANKLLESIAAITVISGHEIDITASIGISIFPDDGNDGEELLRHADAAMYHAKQLGSNNYQFFTAEMNRRARQRLAIENKLRHALEREELLLYYQPQVERLSGRIIGAEALLRWKDPETGIIEPKHFISIAEETGLIIPIGEWVLREACRQNATWRRMGLPEITVSVNLSTVQFRQKNLDGLIREALQENALDPSGLMLEITESVVMNDTDAAIMMLYGIKKLGVKLAMDDFGTGYSSLIYLKRLPIDKLKIDQSFVGHMADDSDDAVIVSTTINMARNLGLNHVAEGVETREQLELLSLYGCDEMQGYYFGKPVPAEEFVAFFDRKFDI
jgi:diguanylate cyclase (GGDEF)-like protein/PAS domain S-box-containing protein